MFFQCLLYAGHAFCLSVLSTLGSLTAGGLWREKAGLGEIDLERVNQALMPLSPFLRDH